MLSYVLVKRNYGESLVNYEFFFCIIWENFVLFGGLLYYLGDKTVGPFLYFLGGIFAFLGGKKSGGIFVFFGGIFVYSGLIFNMIQK
jgi:hypothetical protein